MTVDWESVGLESSVGGWQPRNNAIGSNNKIAARLKSGIGRVL